MFIITDIEELASFINEHMDQRMTGRVATVYTNHTGLLNVYMKDVAFYIILNADCTYRTANRSHGTAMTGKEIDEAFHGFCGKKFPGIELKQVESYLKVRLDAAIERERVARERAERERAERERIEATPWGDVWDQWMGSQSVAEFIERCEDAAVCPHEEVSTAVAEMNQRHKCCAVSNEDAVSAKLAQALDDHEASLDACEGE